MPHTPVQVSSISRKHMIEILLAQKVLHCTKHNIHYNWILCDDLTVRCASRKFGLRKFATSDVHRDTISHSQSPTTIENSFWTNFWMWWQIILSHTACRQLSHFDCQMSIAKVAIMRVHNISYVHREHDPTQSVAHDDRELILDELWMWWQIIPSHSTCQQLSHFDR